MSSKHGATWWSGRFLRSLERLGMTTRLRRGHAYFEEGRVSDLVIGPSMAASSVRGSKVYHCQLHFEPFSDMEWNESLERLAFEDLSAAALLTTGRMPPQIENVFLPSGRRLLPQGSGDLEFHCTCPDRAIPCKHLSATAYALAEKLDLDPWLLFLLRGRSASQVEEVLMSLWNRDTQGEDAPPHKQEASEPEAASSKTQVDLFWANSLKEPILFPANPRPASPLTIERMAFPEPKIEESVWQKSLSFVYDQVSQRAIEALES